MTALVWSHVSGGRSGNGLGTHNNHTHTRTHTLTQPPPDTRSARRLLGDGAAIHCAWAASPHAHPRLQTPPVRATLARRLSPMTQREAGNGGGVKRSREPPPVSPARPV